MRVSSRTTLAGVVVAAAMLTACGSQEPADGPGGSGTDSAETVEVSVGVVPVGTVAPLYLGIEQGFFEEAGLDVTPEVVTTSPAIMASLTSGELDFGFSATASILQAISRGLPLSVVVGGSYTAQTEPSTSLISGSGSGITDLDDLAGATIAVNELQGQSELGIRAVLEDEGVDISTVQFIALPFPEMTAALEQGNADAAGMVNPFSDGAEDAGHTVLIPDYYAEMHDELTVTSWMASDAFIEANEDVVVRFSEALSRSFEYAQEHPDEAKAVIPSYTEFTPEAAQGLPSSYTSPAVVSETVELMASLMADYGMLDGDVDIAEYVAEPVRDRIWQ